jgi:ParB/RepB/Spo0J family partition protein
LNGAFHNGTPQNGITQNETTQNGITLPDSPNALVRTVAKSGPKTVSKPLLQVVLLPVERIEPNPFQPRQSFDEAEMEELVASVRAHGVLQPITVRTNKADCEASQKVKDKAKDENDLSGHSRSGHGRRLSLHRVGYELVAGERRLRASKEAHKRFIPAIVRDDLSDAQAAEMALLENIQRSNLTVIEEAKGYKNLMLRFRMKEDRIAKKVGKSVQTVRDTMKLLDLPEPVQSMIAGKQLTASHGQELLRLSHLPEICVLAAQRVVRDRLTAGSLQSAPLPNALDLRAKGQLVELSFRTEFDWRAVCVLCPHKAFIKSGPSAYCLRPDEWKRKQQLALEVKQQESARVLEEARQAGKSVVEAKTLAPGSYRDLSYGEPPAGCSPQCPCRSEMEDVRGEGCTRTICLDPERHRALIQAERDAHQAARRQRYESLWKDAVEVLREEWRRGEQPKTVALIAVPLLLGERHHYGRAQEWQDLARGIGRELAIFVPWESLFDDEADDAANLRLLEGRRNVDLEGQNERSEDERSEDERSENEKSEPETTPLDPKRLLLLCAALRIGREASEAARYGGETPFLDFVLGMQTATQTELESSQPKETPGTGEPKELEHSALSALQESTSHDNGWDMNNVPSEEDFQGAFGDDEIDNEDFWSDGDESDYGDENGDDDTEAETDKEMEEVSESALMPCLVNASPEAIDSTCGTQLVTPNL